MIGHVLLRSDSTNAAPVAAFIYLFHMPLFFVVARLTLKRESLRVFAQRKVMALLLPYAVFLFLLGLPALVASCGFGIAPLGLGLDSCPVIPVKLVAGGSMLGGIFGAFWFIPCLLGSLILAKLFLSITRNRPLLLLAGALLLVVAYALPAWVPQSTALLSLGTIPMACLFVLAGSALKDHLPGLKAPVLLILVATAALTATMPTTIDMKAAAYGFLILSVVGALAFVCLVLWLSNVLAQWHRPALLLAGLGQRSLTILYLHQAVHLPLRHLNYDNDIGLILRSLALPAMLHGPVGHLLLRLDAALQTHLSRNSPAVSPPLG